MIYKNSLLYLRDKINLIDQELIKIFSERQKIIKKIAEEKKNTSQPIRDIEREILLLKTAINLGEKFNLDAKFIKNIFKIIIQYSVSTQKKIIEKKNNFSPTIFSFLGPKGSYSHIAVKKYNKKKHEKVKEKECISFKETIQLVENKKSDFAILPIENISSGSINEVYDLLQNTHLSIIGEIYIPINHCLLALPHTTLKNIEKIYSHTQPFQQCNIFMQKFPNWKIRYTLSSADAMHRVAKIKKNNIAAIGSEKGGRYYKLKVLLHNISNQKNNITRFIILSNNPINISEDQPAKTTLSLKIRKKVGSLLKVLLILQEHNLIIKKLESRPIYNYPWEEIFFIDILINLHSPLMQNAITKLRNITTYLKILGCYQYESLNTNIK
ncbi:chorismate mutase [Buchnera aphidicola]|uniref:chorismate mutase n=1 Tax=Buchnera aphidicola TaxID=9 RepID=UPI003463F5FD